MQANKNNGIISFVGSDTGQWNVLSIKSIAGEPLEWVTKMNITKSDIHPSDQENAKWVLKAFISNLRYTTRQEKTNLDQRSRGLERPEFNHAALIPIKKSDEWWLLPQDERRKIFEEDSHHIEISVKYLSVISRQLYHCKDLGQEFDFLTWFEFSSDHDYKFDELCDILRKTEEWKYVIREVDIRLEK